MDPVTHDLPSLSTCTSCQFTEDLSNYWTAVLFFKARNGTYKRVPIRGNVGFEGANGGMTVYYMQDGLADFEQKSTVTAFRPVSPLCPSCQKWFPLRAPPEMYVNSVESVGFPYARWRPGGSYTGKSRALPPIDLHVPARPIHTLPGD